MKTFVTLLAAISSLSAYTLVGVHAKCATCPTSLLGEKLYQVCSSDGQLASCQYKNGLLLKYQCYFKADGVRDKASDSQCPHNVEIGNDCHCTGKPEI